jgi:hypothetical protein
LFHELKCIKANLQGTLLGLLGAIALQKLFDRRNAKYRTTYVLEERL